MLTNDEAQFVAGVSAGTGIDPRVLITWIAGEGHPGDMYHNYMNIKTSTAASIGSPTVGTAAAGTAEFADVQTGIQATIKEMRSLGLGNLAHQTPRQTITRIAASPWAESHYGGPGGPNLVNDFNSLFHGGVDTPWQPPQAAVGIASAVGTGSAADAGSTTLGDAYRAYDQTLGYGQPSLQHVGSDLKTAVGSIDSVGKFLSFVTSWRFAELLGGFLLLIVGLILLGRQFGLQVPAPSPLARSANSADDAADSTFAFEPGERRMRAAQASRRTSRQGTSRRMQSHTLAADRPTRRRASGAGPGDLPAGY